MSLNIKNPETHKLARELAEATDESVTEAVTVAVREWLDLVKRPDREALRKKLRIYQQEVGRQHQEAVQI